MESKEEIFPAKLENALRLGDSVNLLVEAELPTGKAWLVFKLQPTGVMKGKDGVLRLMVQAGCSFRDKRHEEDCVNAQAQGEQDAEGHSAPGETG
jgi:hypothetical protein